MKEQMIRIFHKIFPANDTLPRVYFAPGRVNLIGEHTDYNGGHVFPCAITLGTYAAVLPRTDRLLRFYSENFPELGILEVSLDDLKYEKAHDWTNYPKAVLWAMGQKGFYAAHGFDVVYYGTIPNGSGLSSSASIEVLTGFFCRDLFGWNLDLIQLALISQMAENQFVGMNCGIMDQFAIAMGQTGRAIFLDTNTLEYQYAPLELGDYRILILNTNKKRGLTDSKYNERRAQCEEALRRLQTRLPVATLGDLTLELFETNTNLIDDILLEKRARHAVSENQRTIAAVKALADGNLLDFSRLVNASGDSLRHDYEVTGIELDTLVDATRCQPGVLCARMTGAGFGGCAVSLVHKDALQDVIRTVGKIYRDTIGYDASFYEAQAGNGPAVL